MNPPTTTTTPSPPTTTTTTPSPLTTTTTTIPSPPTTTNTTTPSPPTSTTTTPSPPTTTTTTPSPPTTTTTTPSPPTTTTTTILIPPTTTTITTPSPPTSTTTITTTTTPSPPTNTTTPSQSTSTTTTTTATTSTTTPSLPTTTTTTSSTTTTTTTTKNGKVKYGLKIIHMHYCVSRVVLYKVFRLGTPHKDPGVDVITCLQSLPSDYPVNYVNANANQRKFDLSQKAMIKVNTSGDEFDITLLVQCIKLACEGVVALDNSSWWTNGNELENCVYMIRNGAMHGSLSITKAEFESREKNLLSFILGSSLALDVTLVFTDIEIKHWTNRRACVVSYQDFLIEIHNVPGRRVVLLEGVAGSAWVWDQDPDALGITTTQTELYYHTHRLSKMKLQQRLSNHKATCDMSQATISDLIDEWEEVLCKELLVALSLNQLVLTPEAVRRLRSEAMNRGLPDEEMLGGFLTSKCIKLGLQQYSAPHKGLQDYYVALHIVESLRKYHQVYTTSSRLMSRPMMKRSSIRKVLNDTLASSITDLKMYQNVLQHLAGLLHLHIDPVPNHMVVEVVELLRDAGVRNREQWLDLVEDTKASPAVLTAIASNALPFQGLWSSISSIFSHPSINVKDGRVIAYSALLPYLTPTEVRDSINGKPPNLTPLVDSLVRYTYTLELWDLWYHPNPTYTPNASIQTLLSSSGMVTFKGQWTRGMESISPSLRYLSLSLSDGNHVTQLVPLLHSLPRLKYLEIHVPPSVSLADLSTTTPLPEVPTRLQMSLIESAWSLLGFTRLPGAHLYQTDLRPGGESRACQVVASLQPPNAYGWLYFPDSTLGPLEWELVLKTLGEFGVKAKGIRAPGPSTTHDNNLDTIARTQLDGGYFERCDFSRWW
ncbi:hypothetical protein Pcinc_004799 [Petrolisthes cinctipes]|uniref:Uncharacterized protein n=1 Tax=Petrolisthes cinctipes TaxID=88211 RepID=A0AAE1GE09_PETCI|nr:hypothetical protein Pcinc_004799 [Petrolisthes cinctipes]